MGMNYNHLSMFVTYENNSTGSANKKIKRKTIVKEKGGK